MDQKGAGQGNEKGWEEKDAEERSLKRDGRKKGKGCRGKIIEANT